MNLLTPLAFALAALLPAIIALYFLKLRRTEQRVSSTYLWRTLVRDTAANAPWQRLKLNWLLVLQLLFVLALMFALARPFLWSDRVASSHLILVMDTSASMGATDVAPSRLGDAVSQARRLVENLAAQARVTVIDAGASVRVPLSGVTDRGAALTALDELRPSLGGSDMASALTLAGAMAANEPDAQVVILSDGRVTLPENFTLPARAQFIPVGSGHRNQALGAFTLSGEAGGQTLSGFVQVKNYDDQPANRRIVLRNADGALVAARDLTLPPNQSQAFTFPDLEPEDAYQVELEGQDQLLLDDRAWAVAPARDRTRVRVVTTGNRFLETALALLPQVELTTLKPEDYSPEAGKDSALVIFDSVLPTATWPSGSLLFIAPPRATEFFSVTGRIQSPEPIVVGTDDPVARYVDLHDVVIQDAAQLAVPTWGRAVWADRVSGAPLVVVGEEGGRRLGILAFDLRASDLPLRVAFPLLLANLLDALAPGGIVGTSTNVEPGRALAFAVAPEVAAVTLRAPDGAQYTATPEQGRATFDQTAQTGVYEVFAQTRDGSTRRLGRFAVNALNAAESDIAPRSSLAASGTSAPTGAELPRARTEWWQPLAWLALVLLVVEWLVAYRGQVVQLVQRATKS